MMFYGRDFSILNFVRRTKNTRGTFLFQGLVPRTFGIAPEKALKMQAWVLVGRWVDRHVESPTITKWILAGAGAGAATTLIGCPSERAMVLAHIQKRGFVDVIRTTGVRGLYHGFEATLYRDITFNMAFFTIREIIVRMYRNHFGNDPNPFQRTLMGIASGTMASVFACPMDVVKTRIQGRKLGQVPGAARAASNSECFPSLISLHYCCSGFLCARQERRWHTHTPSSHTPPHMGSFPVMCVA
jgi:solute carrier family 25 aspartate/glutamate transporter 12/13/solute carrier family 25 carnitine/acylcarnitine transporter 20/29